MAENIPAFQFAERTVRRFWAKVQKPDNPTHCWRWVGAKDLDGYGYFWDGQAHRRAHRYALALTHRLSHVSGFVLHSCDNPTCVNPTHLRIGTASDNIRERNAKGRANLPSGDRHWYVAMTQEQADAIRAMVAAGSTQTAAAKSHKVGVATVCRLINGKHRMGLR